MIQAGAWYSLLVATGQARAEHGKKVRRRGGAGHCTPSHKPEPGPDMRSDKVNIDCGPAWGVERELANVSFGGAPGCSGFGSVTVHVMEAQIEAT